MAAFSAIFLLVSCEKEIFVEPQDEATPNSYGSCFINSNPVGTEIYLNSKTTGLRTPDTVKWLDKGEFQITLKKNNFRDTSFAITIPNQNAEGIFVDYSLNSKMLGKIICASQPAGMQIFLDGVNTGKTTPYTLAKLLPKVYNIRYASVGYWDESATITVRSSATENFNIAMNDSTDILLYNPRNSPFILKVSDYFPYYSANCMGEDKNGNMWFGNPPDRGLVKLEGQNFITFGPPTDFAKSIMVSDMVNDSDNNLWIGFPTGIEKFDGQNWTFYESEKNVSLSAYGLNIAGGTDRGGLAAFKNGIFSTYTTKNSGIKSGDINAATFDKDGKLWAQSYGICMNVYDGETWARLDSASGQVPTNYFLELHTDPNGNVIGVYVRTGIGLPKYILTRYENGVWNTITEFTWPDGNGKIYVDREHKLWIGNIRFKDNNTYEDIFSIVDWQNIKMLNKWNINSYLKGNTYVDSKGNLWIYNNPFGVLKIKPGRWKH